MERKINLVTLKNPFFYFNKQKKTKNQKEIIYSKVKIIKIEINYDQTWQIKGHTRRNKTMIELELNSE